MKQAMPEVVEQLREKVEERSLSSAARLARRRAPGLDSPARHTVGGQGKSGAKPARSRHCDRAATASHDASQPLRRDSGPGKARQPARKPGDLPPASQSHPSRKGWLQMTTRIRFAPARARALLRDSLALLVPSAASATVTAKLRVAHARPGARPGHDLHRRRRASPSPTRPDADCFGAPGGSRRRVHATRRRTRSACSRPPAGRPSAVAPLSLTDQFGFGLGVCGIGGVQASAGASFWYLKVNHAEATVGADQLEVQPRRRGPLLPRARRLPEPEPGRARAGRPGAAPQAGDAVHGLGARARVRDPVEPAVRDRRAPAARPPGSRSPAATRRRPPAPDGSAQLAVAAPARRTLSATRGRRHPLGGARDLRRRRQLERLPGGARRADRRQPAGRPDQGHRGRRLDPLARRRRQGRRPRRAAPTRSTAARDATRCGSSASRRRRPKIKGSCERVKRK